MKAMRTTDKSRLLALLTRHADTWVSLPEMCEVMSPCSITKRVSELRADGFDIQNETWRVGYRTHSKYKLVTKQTAAA